MVIFYKPSLIKPRKAPKGRPKGRTKYSFFNIPLISRYPTHFSISHSFLDILLWSVLYDYYTLGCDIGYYSTDWMSGIGLPGTQCRGHFAEDTSQRTQCRGLTKDAHHQYY